MHPLKKEDLFKACIQGKKEGAQNQLREKLLTDSVPLFFFSSCSQGLLENARPRESLLLLSLCFRVTEGKKDACVSERRSEISLQWGSDGLMGIQNKRKRDND